MTDCNVHDSRLTAEFNGIFEFIIFFIFLYGLSAVASSLTVFHLVE